MPVKGGNESETRPLLGRHSQTQKNIKKQI